MEHDIKISFIVSFLLHASIFLIFSLHIKKNAVITVPIDLMYFNAPAPAPAPAEPQPEVKKDAPIVKAVEKGIALEKKKKRPVKEAPKAAPKPVEPPKTVAPQSTPESQGTAQTVAPASPGPVNFDLRQFPYQYYINTLTRKVKQNFRWEHQFGSCQAIVRFSIQRSGRITDISLYESSGDKLYDELSLRAIKLTDPMPPLPDGYQEDTLDVRYRFLQE